MDTRTTRILNTFHLFYYCKEVEISSVIGENFITRKTALRDIQFLKKAGLIEIKYSRRYKAFIPIGDSFVPRYEDWKQPDWPEGQSQRLYMEKIIRLCTLMTQVVMREVKNPIEWYREHYPKLSDRTRQRDFLELKKAEYIICYDSDEDWDSNGYLPPGYGYIYPGSPYEV